MKDVLSNRKLLALLLAKKGINFIDFAEDGEQAISEVLMKGVGYYDIIFLDNTMPIMVNMKLIFNAIDLFSRRFCVL